MYQETLLHNFGVDDDCLPPGIHRLVVGELRYERHRSATAHHGHPILISTIAGYVALNRSYGALDQDLVGLDAVRNLSRSGGQYPA